MAYYTVARKAKKSVQKRKKVMASNFEKLSQEIQRFCKEWGDKDRKRLSRAKAILREHLKVA